MGATLTLAVAQSPGELVGTQERLAWLEASLEAGAPWSADLLVLPELFLTGYKIGDQVAQWAEPCGGSRAQQIADLAQRFAVGIHYGYAEQDGDQIFNAAACFGQDGSLLGHHRKLLLPPGFEADHFSQGQGCQLFRLKGFCIATLICYDAEFPETFRHVAGRGADLVLVPTALTDQWGVVARSVMPTRAFESGVFLCYANHAGQEADLSYLGASCIIAPDGSELARAQGAPQILQACLELDRVQQARHRLPYLKDRKQLAALDQS